MVLPEVEDGEVDKGIPIIGHRNLKKNKCYLYPDLAFGEVQKALINSNNKINFTKKSIAQMLKQKKFTVEFTGNRTTYIVKHEGRCMNVWSFPDALFFHFIADQSNTASETIVQEVKSMDNFFGFNN